MNKIKTDIPTKFEINQYCNTLVNMSLTFYYFNKAKLHCCKGPHLQALKLNPPYKLFAKLNEI